jgi:hypothetical protein
MSGDGSIVLEHPKGRQTCDLGVQKKMMYSPPIPGVFCGKSSQSIENKGRALQKARKSSEDAENNRDNLARTQNWC